jgi:hypothetical protein
VSLFEEIGLHPEIFDSGHYQNLMHQQIALSGLLPRLRTTTLVRAVEETKWKTEVSNRCRSSLLAQKVLQTLMKESRIVY